MPEDSGMYECVASSRSGKYVWRAYLHVELATNPSAVFRRTGFDITSLRPREPMKPTIVKVDSTSVTIAWHPKYFQFASDLEDGEPRPEIQSGPSWSEAISQSEGTRSFVQRTVKSSSKRFRNGGGVSEEDDYDDDLMVDDPAEEGRSEERPQHLPFRWVKREVVDPPPHAESLFHQNQHQEDNQVEAEEGDFEFNPAYLDENEESDEFGEDMSEEYKDEKSHSGGQGPEVDGLSSTEVEANQAQHERADSRRNNNNLIIKSASADSNPESSQSTSSSSTIAPVHGFEHSVVTAATTTTTTSTSPPPLVPPHSPVNTNENSNNNNNVNSRNTNNKQVTYKVEYYSADEVRTEWLLGATNVPHEIITLHYLKPNTEYIFFVRSVTADGLVSSPSLFSDSVITSMSGSKNSQNDLATARSKLEATVAVVLKQAYPTSATTVRIEWQVSVLIALM